MVISKGVDGSCGDEAVCSRCFETDSIVRSVSDGWWHSIESLDFFCGDESRVRDESRV